MLAVGLYAQQTEQDVQMPPQSGERVLGSIRVPVNNRAWSSYLPALTNQAYHAFPNQGELLVRGVYFENSVGIGLVVTTTPDPAVQISSSNNGSASNSSANGDMHKALEDALDRALADIPSRSRIGLGHITTRDRTIRRALSETIEDILLDHNMRIVDRSEQHVVIEELGEDSELLANFRHADYVLTVRMDDSSIRVRLLNVRNGEVAGMATS
jgi:hypothetical protein